MKYLADWIQIKEIHIMISDLGAYILSNLS